jgi:cellulose synthase/poly-beta-1,6-N-acetylglucosamine synthase-like glycosyltransferase
MMKGGAVWPLVWLLVALVLVAAVPLLVAAMQFLLIIWHGRHDHLDRSARFLPRVAVLVPAHNESAVLDVSLERFLSLDYPPDRLRVVVVDDASTDATEQVVSMVARRHPGRLLYLRRDKGGDGKAAALNHGIATLLTSSWMQALLITDADVIFDRTSLRRMVRHLADPSVGAVGAYVREGSIQGTVVTRMVGFEYAAAQAIARRSNNVIGGQACLPGGAQLHTRENLERLGGRIETGTLAEDTVMTLRTQLQGRHVVFDGNAVCWAEEPSSVTALWKQRLRWARGNLQVTRRFGYVWFRRRYGVPGSFLFGIVWFATLLQPALMLIASASLVGLFAMTGLSGVVSVPLRTLWIANALTFVLTVTVTLMADRVTAKKVWHDALVFPGVVSLVIIVASVIPHPFWIASSDVLRAAGIMSTSGVRSAAVLFACVWVGGCMAVASLARFVDGRRTTRWLASPLVYIAGFGPLLCAVGIHALWCEIRRKEQVWEVTAKTGRALAHGVD